MHGTPKYGPADTHLDYANPHAPKGGTLVMPGIGTFDTVNPYSIKGKAAEGLNLVYDRLMGRVWDEPFTLYPLIAERADVAPDRSSVTFFINPKARFQNGAPITADDIIFSFQTLKDQGRPNMRRIYRLVNKVEKRGANEVYFAFGPGYDRETVMILALMPVLSKAYWAGKVFDKTTLAIPVLNGPYKIKSIDPGRRIVYERNPDYWGKDLLENVGHYNFDRIIYDYYRDDTVALESFKSANLTLRREWDAGKWMKNYDFPAVKDGRVTRDALAHGRPEKVKSFIFNTRRAPFDDIRVRQAMTLLFDFEWANQNLFSNQYKRISSYFPNSELAATGKPTLSELKILAPWNNKLSPAVFGPAWQPPTYRTPEERRANLRRADELLEAAGWVVQNGQRVKDGKTFKFEMILSAPEDEKIALHFMRSLERLGIKPIIRVMDSAAYLGRLNAYDYDMTLYYWLSTLSPGTEQILYWGCKAAQEPARWNYAGICAPAIEALSGAIAQATSREDLVSTVHALDRVLTHGAYMVPLYYSGKDYVAYWKPVQRPEKTPLYGPVLETWWMGEN
ncbi:MAG: extracellular solute-binding protein [Alphaproteobacteria bacterium]